MGEASQPTGFALARFSELGLPWIAQQPAHESVNCGQTAEFTVVPAAGYDMTHQWRRANIPLLDGPTAFGSTISGVDIATLTITNVQPEDAGERAREPTMTGQSAADSNSPIDFRDSSRQIEIYTARDHDRPTTSFDHTARPRPIPYAQHTSSILRRCHAGTVVFSRLWPGVRRHGRDFCFAG